MPPECAAALTKLGSGHPHIAFRMFRTPHTSIVLLALAAMVAAQWAAGAAAPVMSSKRPLAQLMGRFSPGPDGQVAGLPQWFSWAASSATVSFEGSSSVAAVLDASTFPVGDDWLRKTRSRVPQATFQFELDGKTAGSGEISKAAPVLTWLKTGLTPGRHTLRISKLTEARLGAAWLKSIDISPAGRFVPPPPTAGQRSGKRMLFLGDSISVGSGSSGNSKCADLIAAQDASLAFGPLAARALAADYQVLGWSGATIGIYRKQPARDGKAEWPQQLQRLYQPKMIDLLRKADALSPTRPSPAWQYNAKLFSPQVVVLAAGVNDFVNATLDPKTFAANSGVLGRLPSQQAWIKEYEALVREIRTKYPQAHIISMVWPLEVSLVLLVEWQRAALYQQWMAAAASHLAAVGTLNHHFLQLSGEGIRNTDYCSRHPDGATHANVAAQLARFVRAVVPQV